MKLKIGQYLQFAITTLVVFVNLGYSQLSDTSTIKEGYVIKLPRGYVESFLSVNPIESKVILDKWKSPKDGEAEIFSNNQKPIWKKISSDAKGWFSDTSLRGGSYFYTLYRADKNDIVLIAAMGHDMVYINGVPRPGNPYQYKDEKESWEPSLDYSLLPVSLKSGDNDLLFKCSRSGLLKVKILKPQKSIMLNSSDVTIPDFIVGNKIDTWGSILIINSTREPVKDLFIKATFQNCENEVIRAPIIQSLSLRKVAFRLKGNRFDKKGTTKIIVAIYKKTGNDEIIIDSTSLEVRILDPNENRKETYLSNIDGSVQYYAINPASEINNNKPSALFFSLHGAGVEAINQSGSYYPKSWGHTVSPTNRRPYGFSWEDWGRMDAFEVLNIIKEKYKIDENRIYLTGHSMGGHGTWHLGSLFPDQFAALGPSAGWISIWTYRMRKIDYDTTLIQKMLHRPNLQSEMLKFAENYGQLGIYILHGSIDDNVPPQQSYMMVDRLKQFHKDFVFYEQKNANHWWDNSDEPGADCVDWQPMFDYFARHVRPDKDQVREINFITPNPGVTSKNNWLLIDAQIEQLKLSSVNVRYDPGTNRFVAKTDNVFRLAFDTDIIKSLSSVTVILDSEKIESVKIPKDAKEIWFERNNGKWAVASEPSNTLKGHNRYGTFKDAFKNNMIFVYGTKGSKEENKWAFERARYDAEKFWYQGNGSVDVISDIEFNSSIDPDRNVIIYGNSKTNLAWKPLLSDCPIQVGEGFILVGDSKIKGDDLSCIFLRPKKESRTAYVGVVSGTGVLGFNLINRVPFFNLGFSLPDCTIFNSDVLTKGESGVKMIGFFGLDWSIEKGDFIKNFK